MTDIDIMELPGDGICAIIPAPTGFRFTTQAGGTSCTHPSMEGLLIPLTAEAPRGEDPLLDRWWHKPEDWIRSDAAAPCWLVLCFLQRLGDLGGMFGFSEGYRGEGGEAWVPVIYVGPGRERGIGGGASYALQPFIGRPMILTYGNSD